MPNPTQPMNEEGLKEQVSRMLVENMVDAQGTIKY